MLTKHPSNSRAHGEEDEINNTETATTIKNKTTDTSVIEERVKAAAKLEGVSTDKILSRMITSNNNTNVTTNVSNNDRLSKESGIGSSVGSSFDERDDELDPFNNELFNSSSSTNTSVSTENTKISPRASESLDDLDDTTTKLTNENKKSLGIITEEEESNNNILHNNISHLNHSHNHYNNNNNNNNNSFLKKHHQNRITFLDNLDSNSEVTESSTFNDTESSTSGGEPDSPSLLNNLPSTTVNNSSKIELEKRKNSFKRKNSGRSIFSVLSSSSLRSSSSSSQRDSQRGSLSDPEDSTIHHHRGATMPGSPSKPDRILGRSGFSSLSIRRRRSKPTLSVAVSDISNNNNNKISSIRPGSPENLENLSKAGKILGLTISEEKILLDKPVTKKSREVGTTSSSSEEKILSPPSTKLSNSKVNKLLGYDDKKKLLNKQSKASKILGFDDHELNRRSPSMYVDKASFDLRGGTKSNLSGGSTGDRIGSPITVASIRNNIIYKGFLTKYTNTNFVLSKSWKSWKSRYFILAKNTLYCFKSSDNNSQLLDQFELTANSVVCVSETFNKSWVLQVGKSNQKPWYIQADNVDDMIAWLTELKSIVVKCNDTSEMSSHLHSNSTDRLLRDDYDDGDDDEYDYYDNEECLNDDSSNHKNNVLQRTFSSPVNPTQIVYSPTSPSSIDDNSPYSLPPPPRPSMKTSPRSRSAPSSPSSPPSPTTSLSPPPRPISPPFHVPIDIEELSFNDNLEIPRSSSPVETLSPPRARFGDSTQSHQHNGSISSSYSGYKQRSNSANSSLSINTTIQQQSSSRQSPVINNSPKRLTRNSSISSYRESIPIMMPSWGLRTASPTSMLNPSLPYPPLSPPSSRNGQQIPHNSALLTSKPLEGPKPPPRIIPDRHLTRSPPPNIPLPQPPPRPKNTLTSASRATSPIPSRNNNHIIIPPLTSHPIPPPIPPPRRPSTDARMGGKGTNSAVTNSPVPTQNMKPAESSSSRRPSLHERTMTLPTNLPSCPPSLTVLPARSRSPPPLRNNTTSMVYSSSPSRFQTMSIHLPSYVTLAPLPPPTRPPNVPLPPVPNQSPPLSTIIPSDTTDNKDIITSTTQQSIEFPDDDDLDPDYADELAASRIRSSQKTITNSLPSPGNQQLPASGLTFVMVEETLCDGELVLDLQDVSKDHPHIISRSSSRNNIHNDFLIRNDKEEKDIIRKNPLVNAIIKNLEGKGREKKDKEMVTELESKSVEGDTINDVINVSVNGKVEIVNNSDKNNISPSMLSI